MSSPPPAPDLFDRRPILILILLTIGFFWRLVLSRQFTFLESPDLAYQVLPWYQVEARAFHHGVFPMWDPYQWSGQSLLGQMQPGAAFPLNWLLFLMPLRDGHLNFVWVHRHFVLMHILAALFMYAFCRRLGSSRFASLMAGAAFALGGYMGTTLWPQMLEGAMWIPLVFLFFHRMVEQAQKGSSRLPALSSAALCGGTIGVSLLSGHHQTPMFTLLALCGVFLYFLCARPGLRLRLLTLFGAVGVFAFLVSALQLLPAAEYGMHAYRWVGTENPVRMNEPVPYLAAETGGLYPISLLGVVFPRAFLTTDPFLGFVCLSFALFAVFTNWRLARVRIYSVLALAAVAYASGIYSVLHGLIYALVPFADKARSPGHAIFVFQFAAFTLTAQGIDCFFSPQEPEWERWRHRIIKALAAAGSLAWIAMFWLYMNMKFETKPGDHVALASMVAFVLAGVLYGFGRGRLSAAGARAALIALLLFEMGIASYWIIPHRSDPLRAQYLHHLTDHAGIVQFLKAQPGPFRFDLPPGNDFPANMGDWEGLEGTRGYLASVSAGLFDFMSWDWTQTPLLLNTVYVVSKTPTRPNQREVFADSDGWKVFRNEDALPRAWVVQSVRMAPSAREAAAIFGAPGFDPRRETVLLASRSEKPPLEPCTGEAAVEVTGVTFHHVAALARTPCRAMVVFGDPYFPGWRARVDGSPAALYAPFGALRGVIVPPGTHKVELVYRPRSVLIGALLSALGFIGCACLAWLARSRSSQRTASR
ncbi:MAG TPA: hypothetical protein VFA54_04475 [Bryobacterales bacterium]|nr:hypothetical protein [Bryobacterales bacterium]